MKLTAIVVVIACVVLVLSEVFRTSSETSASINSGNNPVWKSFDAGIALASSTRKKILIDVYTDWCGWCKKMDKEVYGDDTILQLLSERFIAVKLNAESPRELTFNGTKMSEREFARRMGVTGYPTTLFLEQDTKPITLVPGFIRSEDFADILRFIGENHYRTMSFEDFLLKKKR